MHFLKILLLLGTVMCLFVMLNKDEVNAGSTAPTAQNDDKAKNDDKKDAPIERAIQHLGGSSAMINKFLDTPGQRQLLQACPQTYREERAKRPMCEDEYLRGKMDAQAFQQNPTLAVSGNCGCAVKEDGSLTCWKDNRSCNKNFVPSDFKTQENGSVSVSVRSVAMGDGCTCVVQDEDGMVRCWRDCCASEYTGTCKVPQNLGSLNSLSMYGENACALRKDGKLACWNFRGGRGINYVDTGVGSIIDFLAPPSDLGKVLSVVVGYACICAVLESNNLRCWGLSCTKKMEGIRSVSMAHYSYCAVQTDGRVSCWPEEGHSALSHLGALPDNLGTVRSVSVVSDSLACAVRDKDGKILCWGENAGASEISNLLMDWGPIRSVEGGCAVLKNSGVLNCRSSHPLPSDSAGVVVLNSAPTVPCGMDDCKTEIRNIVQAKVPRSKRFAFLGKRNKTSKEMAVEIIGNAKCKDVIPKLNLNKWADREFLQEDIEFALGKDYSSISKTSKGKAKEVVDAIRQQPKNVSTTEVRSNLNEVD
ncbi:MAG: hypothetical protein HQK53_03320 [Oligoflexia bacterium]|nr:hypothetical protein [Oligoflexia bacterium]